MTWIQPFSKSTYALRRRRLAQQMQKRTRDFTAVFFSGREKIRNADAPFPFRVLSNFFYLTGFEEPECILLIESSGKKTKVSIGLRPRDQSKNRGSELWDGERLGVERALKTLQVDEAFDIAEAPQRISKSLHKTAQLYWGFGDDEVWDKKIIELVVGSHEASRDAVGTQAIHDPRVFLHEMRKVKSREEIAMMRKSAVIAAKSHIRAMQSIRPGQSERDVQSEVEHQFLKEGAIGPSYETISASGENACTLHYRGNSRTLKKDDLLLLDAGSELNGYASDITRTFPASGRFSPAQREVYEWVLKSQEAAIRAVKPGVLWNRPHEVALNILIEGLRAMGILKESAAKIKKDKTYREYFPHGTSHWLGLDVHDCGSYVDEKGKPIKLKRGNVLTIEPGLYFRRDQKKVPKRYRGIGVRIEDDVVVTQTGFDVLSKYCPKTVEEIEALHAS